MVGVETFVLYCVGVKVKVVNLYSASSCTTCTSNVLFVTNQSRRSHSRRVQPANTGWRTSRSGSPVSPVSCTKVPTSRNPYNGLLLIQPTPEGWQAEFDLLVD